MYVTLKQLLEHAEQGGYTVLAPNVFNLESLIAVVEAAEAERAPVIIAIGESRLKDPQLQKYLPVAARQMAEEASVPVGINLDHGKSYHELVLAIQKGFSSVMIDASMCPYEENVARTREIVKIAHELGISVEAEIGHVGQGEDYTENGAADGMDNLVRASRLGIRKLNINTELLIEAREQVRRELQEDPEIDYSVLLKHGKDAVVRRLRTYMQALHSSGKAWS